MVKGDIVKLIVNFMCLGALQIASAVPGLLGSEPSERDTTEKERESPETESRPLYSRQSSRGSIGTGRRGSGSIPPQCMSKRGSICAYSGGQVCEVTPVGEMCETRIAMMKSDKETVTNGHGEHQEVWSGESKQSIHYNHVFFYFVQ